MSDAYKVFATQDEYCIDLQASRKDELEEIAFEFAGNKAGLKIIAARIAEIEKQIAMLKARVKP